MAKIDEDYPAAPVSRRAHDEDRRASARPSRSTDAEVRALELATSAVAGVNAIQDDVAEIRAALGRAPSPGHEGTGLIGAVSDMQATLARLDPSERRGGTRARNLARSTGVVALIAALGGGAGIAGIVEAARGHLTMAEERPHAP
ncbi:hypothetical protein WME90_02035 [Sorangium sp. So ce375]|uniref:hypothetical protein n=1 Tax=Sorangium sp. So ce375 TaxID=3133306 RepID=UPI003F5B8127